MVSHLFVLTHTYSMIVALLALGAAATQWKPGHLSERQFVNSTDSYRYFYEDYDVQGHRHLIRTRENLCEDLRSFGPGRFRSVDLSSGEECRFFVDSQCAGEFSHCHDGSCNLGWVVGSLASVKCQLVPQAPPQPTNGNTTWNRVTPEAMIEIAPDAEVCNDLGEWSDECATADQAALAFRSVFSKYGLNSLGAQAAVIAWEAFESAEFKYKINHYPGNPGQGTRCMMMPDFVTEYATHLYGPSRVAAASTREQVLDLANSDHESSFGGGAWFMREKCPDLIEIFNTQPDMAWANFTSVCVGTDRTRKRDDYWFKAKSELGINN
jgi:hypothetical protein